MKVSVVIPAYNEEKDIREAVLDVVKVLPDAEIIVVNDASTDQTLAVLEALREDLRNTFDSIHIKILTNEENCGHGYTVVRGLKEAKGEYILYIDADRQIALDNLKNVSDEYDITSGWRIKRQDKPFRKFISFCLKMTNLVRHGYYIRDANCPFKLYKRQAIVPLLNALPQTYIVPIACLEVLARRYGLKTQTIKTPHLPYQGERKGFLQALNPSALKFFKDAFFEVVKL